MSVVRSNAIDLLIDDRFTRVPDDGARDDVIFFAAHPDRHVRIRVPMPAGEHDADFRSLGDHQIGRRRIIVFRGSGGRLPRIPFLLHADEDVADTDMVLRPILKELMRDAAASYGMSVPGR